MSFIQTNDNTRIFYQDWGTGKPVVFVHAWAMNSDMWEPHMLHFNEQGMRSIAYDKRGHGRSDRPGSGYDYDQYADDLETLLSHLKLDEVTLIGHSMGGGEIVRYLSRHGSSRISKVVLIASGLPYLLKTEDNTEGLDAAVLDMVRNAVSRDFPKWLSENANAFYLPDRFAISSATIKWTIDMILTSSLKAAVEGIGQVYATDFREELKRITLPVLMIHGSADASIPVVFGRKAAKLIPDCEYKEYDGAPHGLFLTHFEHMNADILKFVTLHDIIHN